ncbi:hypothetical protein DZ956_022405 [Pseudomonas aeruginosa]|uniref:hypothetical protein n=1 Tax=Pseudomonas aeruginosa TaxID=287 RepID=UPI0011C14EE6|nr:hypothetical protein [Pseudomonas aeruginosa]NPZ19530.1 hypothetical protein [Pseudomonas aeruginosa]
MRRVLRIDRCTDPLMWYRENVGYLVDYRGPDGPRFYLSREAGGYTNIVRQADATLLELEDKDIKAQKNICTFRH